ncbi:hypothetical protein JI739_04160 [Ramlibacter sp. AW1]|uniref:Lipoprotein n=1 Tax=Ramlibacter aurantiacus TaxID=2801330 RepID=A0A936ZGP7_9BURK|nr:hypothetical protein [Ramlibacter aurantiacus]MBL0419537.1 hypothetical protein [Ramlibacter aurantiacus]
MNAALGVFVLTAGAVLAACGQGADTGATRNPNAPGSPGDNPPVTAIPRTDPGRVSPGDSLPLSETREPGASAAGITGSGSPPGANPPPTGAGMPGGLGGTASPSPQGAGTSGSTNATTGDPTGSR